MGRPRIGKRIVIRLRDDQVVWLQSCGRSLPDEVRRAVDRSMLLDCGVLQPALIGVPDEVDVMDETIEGEV